MGQVEREASTVSEPSTHKVEYFGSEVSIHSFPRTTVFPDGGSLAQTYTPPEGYIALAIIQGKLLKEFTKRHEPNPHVATQHLIDGIFTNPRIIGYVPQSFIITHDPSDGAFDIYCSPDLIIKIKETPFSTDWEQTNNEWLVLRTIVEEIDPRLQPRDPVTTIAGFGSQEEIRTTFRLPPGAIWRSQLQDELFQILKPFVKNEPSAKGKATAMISALHTMVIHANLFFGYRGVRWSENRTDIEWYLTPELINILVEKNSTVYEGVRNFQDKRIQHMQQALKTLTAK